jgi:hypothetical protein
VWWCTCNPEFGRLREEDFKFEANLGYDPISKERERERERERGEREGKVQNLMFSIMFKYKHMEISEYVECDSVLLFSLYWELNSGPLVY